MVILRGDPPKDDAVKPLFRHASDLVAHVGEQHGDTFDIEVGCYPELHPESPDMDSEIRAFLSEHESELKQRG